MEQYIYIFTIILETIVAVQLCLNIVRLDKKATALLGDIKMLEGKIAPAIAEFRSGIRKFNKIASYIIKAKKFAALSHILSIVDIISIFFLFKSFRTYKGLNKLKFLRKLFSYSVVRSLFSYLKTAI